MMNSEQIVAVITEYLNGATIEYKSLMGGEWTPLELTPAWNFTSFAYRAQASTFSSSRKKVVIDRSLWRYGGEAILSHGPTYLVNELGLRCAIGFLCEQVFNIPPEDMVNVASPKNIQADTDLEFEFIGEVSNVNDSTDISNEDRESRLTELFNEAEYDLEFIGSYGLPYIED